MSEECQQKSAKEGGLTEERWREMFDGDVVCVPVFLILIEIM